MVANQETTQTIERITNLRRQALDVDINRRVPGTNEQHDQHADPDYEVVQEGSGRGAGQVLSGDKVQ